jgi:hypothetical protein
VGTKDGVGQATPKILGQIRECLSVKKNNR